MSHRALTHVMLGHDPPAEPGDLIPDTYLDLQGNRQKVDFDRLVELGAAEKVAEKAAPKSAKKD